MKLSSAIFLFSIFLASCSTPLLSVLKKGTAHENYRDKQLDERSAAGKLWIHASKHSIQNPFPVVLPYSQTGAFYNDAPRAMGLNFLARRGEKVMISVDRKTNNKFTVFADLFKKEGNDLSLVFSADTALKDFFIDVDEEGEYVLRVQPALDHSGNYDLNISIGPSLLYPVAGNKAKAGSFWGAPRDGGKRRHEGVDIFAPKGTPVLASADGVITARREGGIGGKTIWMKPAGRNINLYYAHLDEQFVQPGQKVIKGDTIGTVGHTGNAMSTAPHLHFGVYNNNGATDPYPFINKNIQSPTLLSKKELGRHLELTSPHKLDNGEIIPIKTILVPLAHNSKGYVAELTNGPPVLLPFNKVKPLKNFIDDKKISVP
jgi:peptidoglycan LD-endopeptidase LytH